MGRRVVEMYVNGKRRKGRQKQRWMNSIKDNLRKMPSWLKATGQKH